MRPDDTIVSLLCRQANDAPDAICIECQRPDQDSRDTLSRQALVTRLHRRARHLGRHYGLGKGDTLVLVADNSLEYLLTVYGAIFAGIAVLVVATKSLPEHLGGFIARAEASLVLYSEAHAALAQAAVDDLPAAAGVALAPLESIARDETDSQEPGSHEPEASSMPALQPDETAVILHTSGTTRTPKLVYLSHRTILANQRASAGAFDAYWTGADSTLCWLPLFHGYALLAEFLRDMLTGARFVLYPAQGQLNAEELLAAMDRNGTTILCCVPWMLGLFRDRILAEEAEGDSPSRALLQGLKFIVTGGSSLGDELGDFFRQREIRIVTMFGLSEAAGFVLHSPFDGSHWDQMLPNAPTGVEFRAIDDSEREHELVITDTDLFSQRVLGDPDTGGAGGAATELRTGDLFMRRDAGWAYLGRDDQIYNGAHGEKVNPLLFEAALERLEAVDHVFVYGHELPYNVALVELGARWREGEPRERAIALVRETVSRTINPALEHPDRVYPNDLFFLPDSQTLPLTPKGSISRREAATMALACLDHNSRQEAPVSAPLTADAVRDILLAELAGYCPGSTATALLDHTLLELGFDSLMTLSLRNNLQQRLGLELPVDLMLSYPPLRELLATLQRLNNERPAAASPPDDLADRNDWHPIALEQVAFHKAYYLFPGPTFGGSFSLLAPEQLDAEAVRQGLRFLERNHEILRSIYREDGHYRIVADSMVERAFISHHSMTGSHALEDNPGAQALIRSLGREPFDFARGPAWRYATVDIDDGGRVRTMVFIAINHIIGDFRSFSRLVREFMLYLNGSISADDISPDDYIGTARQADPDSIAAMQAMWQTLLTTGLDTLPAGVDPGAGTRVPFYLADINLDTVTGIVRAHNLSLYNTVYAVWALAASRHIEGMSLEDFPSVTSLTTRLSKELEDLMGSFVHNPVYRFCLDAGDDLVSTARKVQQATLEAFRQVLVDPVSHFSSVLDEPRNLMPIVKRNVFLYRSPDEIMAQVPGWGCYRNDYFEERCNVGAYFDFCAQPASRAMEGYLTVNLQFCSPEAAERVVADVHTLMRAIISQPSLDFVPARILQ